MSCWVTRAQQKHLGLEALGAEWCGKSASGAEDRVGTALRAGRGLRYAIFTVVDFHGPPLELLAQAAGSAATGGPFRVAGASTCGTMGQHVGWPILSPCTDPICGSARHGLRTGSAGLSAMLASGARRELATEGDRDRSGYRRERSEWRFERIARAEGIAHTRPHHAPARFDNCLDAHSAARANTLP